MARLAEPAEEHTVDLDRSLAVIHPRDGVMVQVCLLATLYFQRGHLLERRAAVAECFREYRATMGDLLCWAHPGNNRFQHLAPGDAPLKDPARFLIEDQLRAYGSGFTWHGGRDAHSADPHWIAALGAPSGESERQGALSYLQVAFPLTWFAEHAGGLPSLTLRWAKRLQAFHGYGGIGIVLSPRGTFAQRHENEVYGLSRRYPGLEIDYPIAHALDLKHGIKGGNWLTVLAEPWVERLGGEAVLRDALGEGFRLWPYAGGLMIQAGDHPQLGDSNRLLAPAYYGRLARVLKPIRIETHGRIHAFGGLDRAGFDAWLARFDADPAGFEHE